MLHIAYGRSAVHRFILTCDCKPCCWSMARLLWPHCSSRIPFPHHASCRLSASFGTSSASSPTANWSRSLLATSSSSSCTSLSSSSTCVARLLAQAFKPTSHRPSCHSRLRHPPTTDSHLPRTLIACVLFCADDQLFLPYYSFKLWDAMRSSNPESQPITGGKV
jgi:hypothetical protein